MRNSLLRVVCLFFVLLLSVSFVPVALAQEGGSAGITVKPPIIEDRAEPGQVFNFSIKVTNLSDTEQIYYLLAEDVTSLTETGQPVFSDENAGLSAFSLASWIKFNEESITLQPGETREVPFVVEVPSDATPGSHVAGVFFDAEASKLRGVGSGTSVRVGSIVSLRIAGDVVEEANIRSFSSDRTFYSEPKVHFSTRVENKGNVLVRPYGLIEITDITGKKVDTLAVNESKRSVFPSSDSLFEVDWQYDGFAFGRYTATLGLVYGEEAKQTISAETVFWVLPTKPILATLGTLGLLILLLVGYVKMHTRRALRAAGISRQPRSSLQGLFITVAVLLTIVGFGSMLFLMFA